MRYEEVRKLITGSSPDDWAVIDVEGSAYLDRLEGVSSGGQRWLQAASHVYLAIYQADTDLRLAWGMTVATGLSFEGWNFPNRSIERLLVDGFWRDAFVTRWPVLSVDGDRCYLPFPLPTVAAGGAAAEQHFTAGWTVKASEVSLARLLQQLAGREDREFDSYLRRTGAVVVPDEDLG
jgi:hypothetical protein